MKLNKFLCCSLNTGMVISVVQMSKITRSIEIDDDREENRAELLGILTKAKVLEALAEELGNQMSTLQDQVAATSAELNDKFLADVDAFLEFGNRDLFDKGLVDWIGTAFPQSALL